MELHQLLARRRMVRSFDGTPVDLDWLDDVCAQSLRAPSAGHTNGVRMRTVRAELIGEYVDVATDPSWRARSRRLAGLARAGAAVLVTSRPDDYFSRYREPDKATSGLAERSAWPVPYWHTDAAMATMALLLLLEEAGWQAALWGNFRHAEAVLAWAHASGEELFATVLIGRADGRDTPSASLRRESPTRAARVTRVEP